MKTILTLVAWAALTGVILFAALNPNGGVIYDNGYTCLGLGLIGLGICMEVRKTAAKSAAAPQQV